MTDIDIKSIRMVPVLLLSGRAFVKTERFKRPVYLGDPINTIRIFNERAVDEILILDIDATKERRGPDFNYVAAIAEEAFMPLSFGGGISSIEHCEKLFGLGIEKVVVNSALHDNLALIEQVASKFGAQAVAGAIDVKKTRLGKHVVVSHAARRRHEYSPAEWTKALINSGVGEIFVQSVDRDGTLAGYDHDLIREVAAVSSVPIVPCGGASDLHDMARAVMESGASAVAAGGLFVFYGRFRAVLINPPSQEEFWAELEKHPAAR